MFKKRGQITIFIIVGIVIVITVILGITLGSRIMREEAEQELIRIIAESDIGGINNYVEGCLRDSLKNSVSYLGDKNVLNYEMELKERVLLGIRSCVDNTKLRDLGVTRIPIIREIDLIIEDVTDDNIFVTLNWPLGVRTEGAERRLENFNAVYRLTKNCCVPVRVDNNCRLENNINIRICNIEYKLNSGDSLKSGGVCLAC